MLCQYQDIQGNTGSIAKHVRCIHCGHVTKFPVETRECPSPSVRIPLDLPPLTALVLNFAAHLLHWPSAASEATILHRFTQCSACPQYNDALGACCVCGCWINLLKMGEGLNKLSDKKEECPLPADQKRWKKEE